MSRRYSGRKLWDRMSVFAANPDDGPTFEGHPWTLDKLFHLAVYLSTTTTAFVGQRKFETVNYIDLFAGSGICSLKNRAGPSNRFPGSALLAAGCTKPFDNLFFVESHEPSLTALRVRIARLDCRSKLHFWHGDANVLASDVVRAIPASRALNILFVDPCALEVHFETIKYFAQHRSMDIIMLFADSIDIVRNVQPHYYPRTDTRLDLFLGEDSRWRDQWDRLENREAGNVRHLFASIYMDQLRALGYLHAATRPLEGDRGPIYRMLYASKHSLGLKFWNIAVREDRGGDKNLWPE